MFLHQVYIQHQQNKLQSFNFINACRHISGAEDHVQFFYRNELERYGNKAGLFCQTTEGK